MLRYRRHLSLPEIGPEGQRRLSRSSVLCVGAGGLGSPLSLYLAAAGVGRLGLVEFDEVDLTNIQRQILYATRDVGRPKLQAAAARLSDLNPEIEVVPHPVRLASANAMEILSGYDVIADGSDNFATRYLVNDACGLLGKPYVYGSIFRFEGQLAVFDARRGPCYRCLFPEPPPPGSVPSCADAGVLGVLPGIIGSLQALESLKLLLGLGEAQIGRLLLFDALALSFRELQVRKDPACPLCGKNPTIRQLIDYEAFCGAETTSTHAGADEDRTEIRPSELQERMRGAPAGANAVDVPEILDVREPFETQIARIPGARLIPLGELPSRLGELDPDRTYVIHCHTGVRSAYATALMRKAGFRRVMNLTGGIDAWSAEVDPSVPRY